MAQDKNMAERYSDAAEIGTVKIADDVIALIAAFAAMEVEGVSGMAGGIDMDTVSRGGMKKLGRTVKVEDTAFPRPAARCRTRSGPRSRI